MQQIRDMFNLIHVRLTRAAIAVTFILPLALVPATVRAQGFNAQQFLELYILLNWNRQTAHYGTPASTNYTLAQKAQNTQITNWSTSANHTSSMLKSVSAAGSLSNSNYNYSAATGAQIENSNFDLESQYLVNPGYGIGAGGDDGDIDLDLHSKARQGKRTVAFTYDGDMDRATVTNPGQSKKRSMVIEGGTTLYYHAVRYTDGTTLINFYANQQHTQYVGYKDVDAPLWNGQEGTYPVLIRSYGSITLNGVTVQTYSGYMMNNANGTSGQMASLYQDSLGRTIVNQWAVISGNLEQVITVQSGSTTITAGYTQYANNTYQYQFASSNGLQLLAQVNPDSSGKLQLNYNQRYLIGIVWASNLSGYWQVGNSPWFAFSNLYTLL